MRNLFRIISRHYWDAAGAVRGHLVKRLASPVAVEVNSVILDKDANWILLKLTEVVHGSSYDDLAPEQKIDLLLDLIKFGDVGDEEKLYDLVLDAIARLLGTDMISIYRGRAFVHKLCVWRMSGDEVFPPVLSSADVIRLSELVVWKPGRRMFTELHRQGRIAGLKYVASVPIGQQEASFGLLVVGDMEKEPIAEIEKILDFFHFYIGDQLQKLALIENLSSENQKKGFSLSVLTGILEHIDEGVVVLTPQLKVIEINSIAEVLLGYTCTEVCGESVENVLIGSMGLIKSLEILRAV